MTVSPSLFDTSAAPVLPAATDWITGTLLGSIAIALCVIAVAFIGLMLMAGRLPVRDAARVVLGCFVLLGAPVIALGLQGMADGTVQPGAVVEPVIIEPPAPAPLPPSTYDPYAGASLRAD